MTYFVRQYGCCGGYVNGPPPLLLLLLLLPPQNPPPYQHNQHQMLEPIIIPAAALSLCSERRSFVSSNSRRIFFVTMYLFDLEETIQRLHNWFFSVRIFKMPFPRDQRSKFRFGIFTHPLIFLNFCGCGVIYASVMSSIHQRLGKQAVPHNCIAIYAIFTLQKLPLKLHFYHRKMHRHSNAA